MRNVAIRAAACRTNSILQRTIAKLLKHSQPVSDSRIGKVIRRKVPSCRQQSWSASRYCAEAL